MIDNILKVTKQLVRIPSRPDNSEALSKALELTLSHLQEYTIERFEHNGVKSALVYNTPQRPETFSIILNGHLDVIPGKEKQYIPKVIGDRLYGVGTMDMKASLATMVMVFNEVARIVSYPLALQIVTDEEVGGFDGTKYQIDQGVRSDFVIAGESTNFDIVNRTKGIAWVRVTTRGQSAHGAYPWKGQNAIWKMHSFLSAVQQRYPTPTQEVWATTVNVSNIKTSNQAFNKIPDECSVELDIRFLPEESDDVLLRIQSLLPADASLEVIAKEPALYTDDHDQTMQTLRHIGASILERSVRLRGAQGSSDARHYARVNGPGIEFGPIGGGIGSDDEWVDISSLEVFFHILKTFLQSL